MKISLGIGEKKTVTVGGGRFYYESGLGRIRVKTIGSNSGEFELSPGMGFQNRADMDNFFALEIENISGADQDIEFIISYREVFDNRVSFSDVSVVVSNGSKAVVDGNKAFSWFLYSPAKGAGANSAVAIGVKPGLNVPVYIDRVDVSVPVQIEFMGETQFNNTLSAGSWTNPVGSNVSNVNELPIIVWPRYASGAIFTGKPVHRMITAPNLQRFITFDRPLKIMPGDYLYISSLVENSELHVNAQGYV